MKTTSKNISIVLVAGWSSFIFGYSNNVMTGTLAQTSFQAKFLNHPNANSLISGVLGGYIRLYRSIELQG